MTLDERDRRRRRRLWLFLLGFTLVIYPVLLLGSSYFGSSVGLNRDVNASRALARALNYAADPRRPLEAGNDGQLTTTALDPTLVALQLGDGSAPGGSAPGGAPGAVDTPSASPAGGGVPGSGGGGGTVGATPSPASTAPPSPDPTAPPASPSPTAVATPSPTPCTAVPPSGSGTFDGRVRNSQDRSVAGALLVVYWKGCLIGSGTTGPTGRFAIHGLAPNTGYTYVISAFGYKQDTGAFTTRSDGNATRDPQFQ